MLGGPDLLGRRVGAVDDLEPDLFSLFWAKASPGKVLAEIAAPTAPAILAKSRREGLEPWSVLLILASFCSPMRCSSACKSFQRKIEATCRNHLHLRQYCSEWWSLFKKEPATRVCTVGTRGAGCSPSKLPSSTILRSCHGLCATPMFERCRSTEEDFAPY